jgi:hypothetical protein
MQLTIEKTVEESTQRLYSPEQHWSMSLEHRFTALAICRYEWSYVSKEIVG